MVKALIFDLDGVLITSEEHTFTLLQEILGRHGVHLADETYAQRVGKRMRSFVDEVYGSTIPAALKEDILAEFYQEYTEHSEKYAEPITCTVEFIRAYQGRLPMGLASVSSRREIDKILGLLGLDASFQCIVSSDDIENLKPHPEIYRTAAALLGQAPKDCAAVEDSIVGAESALAAGCRTYVLLNGINKPESFVHLEVAGFIKDGSDLQKVAGL